VADREFIESLRTTAEEVIRDHYPAQELHQFLSSGAPYDAALWQKAAELGWLMIGVGEAYGGLGGGIAELAVLQQALAATVSPVPFLSTAIAGQALGAWPDPTLAEELLPQLAEGKLIAGVEQFVDDEPGLTARKIGLGFMLDGATSGILYGSEANWLLVRVAGQPGEWGLALLPADNEGVTLAARPIADRTRTIATLKCHSVIVEARLVVFGPAASALLDRLRTAAALLVSADSIGGARAIFGLTIEYLKTRTQFGKPIGSFQALKHRAADLAVKLEMAAGLVGSALARADGAEAILWAAMAKFSATEAYAAIAADAVQMHGGIGFTWEHRAHLYLKRAALNATLFGDAAFQQDHAAAQLMAS
jgi:alkylation response protein AidB-like acyl-CoA dehydrogenase